MRNAIVFAVLFTIIPISAHASKAFLPLGHSTVQIMGCADTSNTNEQEFLNCDASGNLTVTLVPGAGVAFTSGITDIPAAGVADRTQLAALAVTNGCVLQSLPGNVGPIYVGGVLVTNASGTVEGIRLNQNDSIELMTDNLDEIYVAADNAGDDVKYLCN